jgi:hypothetical protein
MFLSDRVQSLWRNLTVCNSYVSYRTRPKALRILLKVARSKYTACNSYVRYWTRHNALCIMSEAAKSEHTACNSYLLRDSKKCTAHSAKSGQV